MREYTDTEDFVILVIEEGGSGDTRVIVRFADSEHAASFVEEIKEQNSKTGVVIRKVGFIYYEVDSFSFLLNPIALLSLLVF